MHRSADTDQLTRTLNLSYNISKNELDLYPAKPPQPTTQDNQIKEIFAKAHRVSVAMPQCSMTQLEVILGSHYAVAANDYSRIRRLDTSMLHMAMYPQPLDAFAGVVLNNPCSTQSNCIVNVISLFDLMKWKINFETCEKNCFDTLN